MAGKWKIMKISQNFFPCLSQNDNPIDFQKQSKLTYIPYIQGCILWQVHVKASFQDHPTWLPDWLRIALWSWCYVATRWASRRGLETRIFFYFFEKSISFKLNRLTKYVVRFLQEKKSKRSNFIQKKSWQSSQEK